MLSNEAWTYLRDFYGVEETEDLKALPGHLEILRENAAAGYPLDIEILNTFNAL